VARKFKANRCRIQSMTMATPSSIEKVSDMAVKGTRYGLNKIKVHDYFLKISLPKVKH